MAENVGSIYYTVEADVSPLVQAEQQAMGSMDKMDKGFKRVDKSANDSTFTLTKTAQAVQSVDKQAAAANRSLDGLTKLLAGLVTLQGVSGLIQMAEAYGEMAERVQMATSSTEEFNLVQTRLLDTSNRTYRALSESQEVFVRTSAALKSMGYDIESALDVTDSLSFAFVKNATSAARASSATDAFSKVLNKGRVEADAWETILAAVPTVVDDIAAASGKSAEEIRRLGVEGQLTARMLSEGLRKSLDDNRKAADGMATTVKDAFTALKNNLSAMVGEANKATGATAALSKAVLFLADNLQTVVNVLLAAGAGALAKYVAGITATALAQAKTAISARLLAGETLALAVAEQRAATVALSQVSATSQLAGVQTAAAAAAGRLAAANTALAAASAGATRAGAGLLAVLGGPAGLIGIVATVAAGVLLFGDNAKSAAPSVEQLADAVDNLTQAQLELRRVQVGDAIQQIEKEARDSARMVSQLTKDIIELEKARTAGKNIDAEGMRNANASLVEEKANLDKINESRQKLLELEQKLANTKPRERTSAGPSAPAADPEVAKRLQSLRDEAELAKLSGAARARLQAIQKLGANATKEEREEAERLATTIYELENAQKKSGEATKKNAEAEKENQKTIDALATSLYEAGLAGEALAVSKAKNQLNSFATPEQVAQVEAMARAIYAVQEAEANQKLLGQVDPIAGAQMDFATQIENLRKLNEAKLIEDQRYMELKYQAEVAYDERMRVLQEENFRRQSEWNNLLMSGLDQLGQAATDTLVGLATGASTGEDAIRALAGAILREGVSSLVQMGIQYVKNLIMGKAAAAASTAAGVAMAGTLATAYAVPAALASLMSFGANAMPAQAALATTVGMAQALSVVGGRKMGGNVDAAKMYRVNEGGAPEIFNAANGQQFMMPNQRGEVVSNRDATRGQAVAAPNVTVNLIENADRAGTVETRAGEDGALTIDAFVLDIQTGGEAATALEQNYGLTRQGR